MTTKTNRETVTEDYLRWLEPQLRDEYANTTKTYRELRDIMFAKEFTWTVPMDDNRLQDGQDLRVEFVSMMPGSIRIKQDTADILLTVAPVSFLEVLISLSRKMAFVAGGDAPGWAWHLLTNLELHRMADTLTRPKRLKIEEILNTVIDRTYLPNGQGGFFPLAWPEEDMTRVELWYQMNAYIAELHPEH
jgi:hypothetical protein